MNKVLRSLALLGMTGRHFIIHAADAAAYSLTAVAVILNAVKDLSA